MNHQAFGLFGNKVRAGPFLEMEIPEHTPWDDGNQSTKMLGSYEHELHDVLDYARWRRPQVIVNVGCAEGYYAIGLARICRSAAVFAFDISEEARMICADYAERNGVEITIRDGVRNFEDLAGLPAGRRLYLIDIEGAELELIDIAKMPELARSDLIVECHDFLEPAISATLADRLEATHRVERILPTLPKFERYAFVHQFPTVMSLLMLVEKRPMPCCWLACWAHLKGVENG